MRDWPKLIALLVGVLYFLFRLSQMPTLPEAFAAAALACASAATLLWMLDEVRARLPEWTARLSGGRMPTSESLPRRSDP